MSGAFRREGAHVQLILDLAALARKGRENQAGELALAASWGGVDSIQVRGKSYEAGELLERTRSVVASLQRAGLTVAVLVNERLDVALLAGADGVHLPERSLKPIWARSCRELAAARGRGWKTPAGRTTFAVGRSVHSELEACAEGTEELDYVLFGHVFQTGSKPGVPPRGLGALARVASVYPVPVLAVGGITAGNAAAAIEAGAAGVAVISAICDAQDPFEAARELRRAVDAAWASRRMRREGGACASP